MKYILLEKNIVKEIIPEINPVFPGIPIADRYAPDFLAQCVQVSEDTEVEANWIYDQETGEFMEPVVEEIPAEPEPDEDEEDE